MPLILLAFLTGQRQIHGESPYSAFWISRLGASPGSDFCGENRAIAPATRGADACKIHGNADENLINPARQESHCDNEVFANRLAIAVYPIRNGFSESVSTLKDFEHETWFDNVVGIVFLGIRACRRADEDC